MTAPTTNHTHSHKHLLPMHTHSLKHISHLLHPDPPCALQPQSQNVHALSHARTISALSHTHTTYPTPALTLYRTAPTTIHTHAHKHTAPISYHAHSLTQNVHAPSHTHTKSATPTLTLLYIPHPITLMPSICTHTPHSHKHTPPPILLTLYRTAPSTIRTHAHKHTSPPYHTIHTQSHKNFPPTLTRIHTTRVHTQDILVHSLARIHTTRIHDILVLSQIHSTSRILRLQYILSQYNPVHSQ